MRKSLAILSLTLMTTCAPALLGQTPAPAPAPGLARELLNAWNRVGQDIVEIAEAMPAEKYSFKPTPEVRSFGEQLLHIAGANYLFVANAKGEKAGPEDLSPERYPTKSDIVRVLRESFEAGAGLISPATDAQMIEPVKHAFGNQMISRYGFWSYQMRHAFEHRGQCIVYLRLSGIVPPSTARAQARQAPPSPNR